MHTRVDLVARRSSDGRSVLERLSGSGQLAARQTGPDIVHLVGTAAGPLGGDRIDIGITVRSGASLSVRSAAASVVLPGSAAAVLDLVATVEDGGELDLALEPTVVAAGAVLESSVTFHLAGSARVRHREEVALGRWREPAGTWRGTCSADRSGAPLLRHTLCAGPGSPYWVPPHDHRALLAEHRLGGPTPQHAAAVTHGDAVAMPLAAGGLLVTAVASGLAMARRDADCVLGGR